MRIEFYEKESMKPISRLNLEQANQTMSHKVFGPKVDLGVTAISKLEAPKKSMREDYVIQSMLEN